MKAGSRQRISRVKELAQSISAIFLGLSGAEASGGRRGPGMDEAEALLCLRCFRCFCVVLLLDLFLSPSIEPKYRGFHLP